MDGIVTKPNSVHWKRPSWYRRRTSLERRLLVLAVLLGFVALSLVAVLLHELMTDRKVSEGALKPGKSTQCIDQQMCLTDECVEAAAGLLLNMNPKVDPCKDFFEYSCGGWTKSRVIPEGSSKLTATTELKNRLELNCKGLVESDVTDDDIEAIAKTKYFYQACMDEERISSRGFEPLWTLIAKFGGWPLMNDTSFDESTWNLEDTLAKMYSETEQNFFFSNYIGIDPQNNEMHIYIIDQTRTLLSQEDFMVANFSHKNVVAYREYMEAVALELSLASEDEVRHQVLDMLRFEEKLINIKIPRGPSRVVLKRYKKLTVGDLQNSIPQFNWSRYFDAIVSPSFNDTELLGTYSLDYLKRLGTVLHETPTRTIANFLMWKLVHESILLLGRKSRKLREEFLYLVEGEHGEGPRWKQCVTMTANRMSSGMSTMFIQKYFGQQSKTMALQMISKLREAVQETLNETKWMDEPTKARAIEKLLAIREQVGFDETVNNYTVLEQDYNDVEISSQHYFENVFETLKNDVKFMLKNFRRAVNTDRWSKLFPPYKANAGYQYALNQITFPAGFLQHPFYNRRNPHSMNYGGIGMVIGHEIMHAFDDMGRRFDKNGDMSEMWTEASAQGFRRETNCLLEQYGNFTVEQVNRKVNAKLTLGENIADTSGLKVAFKAYRRWIAERGAEEPTLPGIRLTHNQIFFLNYGQLWCDKSRDQALIYQLQQDSHSPGKFRVWGPIMNSPDFSEAFHCKPGSPMNPAKKCSVF
ncbi:endothelin-converting enzyme 1-like isoform X2 [Acanthaster planci]|uniref:Endothelin-converting enzyme 1-like isoform X2 n=1 Tax=Acanthaster planci TaxID=133434 RepID=A0A8B7ZGR2_ACAPL|nr:endothelin-converting enzyme 1-like isoform X2 [Acanthaster planci]